MGKMIHTTPRTEAQARRGMLVGMKELEFSHGCVHIPPSEMGWLTARKDELIGSLFVVRSYRSKPGAR